MDLQSLVNSFHLNKLESWYIYFAVFATLMLCVITYFCYRTVFRRHSAKSKKQKGQKKRSEEKKSTQHSTATDSIKPSVASPLTTSKTSKPTRRQVSAAPEPVSKPEVQAVVPIKAVPKISDPQPKTDVSDADEGPWIEVGKSKKDNKSTVPSRQNKVSGSNFIPGNDNSDDLVIGNQMSVKKKRDSEGKNKTTSGTGKSSGDSFPRTNYKPIEEPTFTQPSKPKRRSKNLDEEEEEWQDVRFSRRIRKFTNKD